MSNPNTTTVYDKKGEAFEMSKMNARDLVEHAGWTFSKPTVIEKIVEVPAETPAAETATEETPAEEEVTEEEATAEVTAEDFAHLEDRDAAAAYAEEKFGHKPHHLAKRDTIIEKIVELTNA
jgi:hypothetical protein